MTTKELATIEKGELVASALMDPAKVLEQAQRAAKALVAVVSGKKHPVIMNGEQYLEYEDWQTVGQFYRYGVKTKDAQPVEINGVQGAKAYAELINLDTGEVLGGAEAYCLRDEPKWNTRPRYEWQDEQETGERKRIQVGEEVVPWFQLASMAQTRAGAKAFRNRLAWVVVLAGYRPTPAEELTGSETRGEETHKRTHWCTVHKQAWFKKGKMQGYAHPIGDGKWCEEPQVSQSSDSARPGVPAPEAGPPSVSQGPATQVPPPAPVHADQKPVPLAPGAITLKREWPKEMPHFGSWAEFQAFYKAWKIEGSEIMVKASEIYPGRTFSKTSDFATYEEAWAVLVEIATVKGLNI